MLSSLLAIYSHSSQRRRLQLMGVLALMLAGAVAEVFTLGAIVPFLGLLVNPSMVDQHPLLALALDAVAPWVGGSRLAAASLAFAVFAMLAAALRLTLNWASLKFVFAVGADFSEAIYSRLLQQPYSYHTQRNSSETLSAVEKVGTMVMGLMAPLLQAGIATVMVAAIFSAMLWVNPKVALGAGLVFGGLYFAISNWAKKQLRINGQVIADSGTAKIKALQEGLGAVRDVIIDGNHAVYTQKFAHADRAQRLAQAHNLVLAGSPKYVVEGIGMVLFVGLALWLASAPGGVAQAVPTLGALALGAQRLLPYMQNIYNGVTSSRSSMVATEEVLALLNLTVPNPSVAEPVNSLAVAPGTAHPVLELRDVSFSYQSSGPVVLQGICMQISCGARVGFVGVTGSGKSTLIDLILGLLPPSSGKMLVDGQILGPHNLRAWQSRIAHVPQAIFLTDSSIAENIALGVPRDQINMARLHQALEQAQMTDVVRQLPQGLDTRVGERGVQLSGGQRQRIGIARALYKRADVLVLDEATSALDSETEGKVMKAIYKLNPHMVVFMIAHRTSTLQKCEYLYEIADHRLTIKDGLQNLSATQRL